MTTIPALGRQELRALLEQVFPPGKRRRSRLLAVQGTGEAGVVECAAGRFTVTPARSELQLRATLPPCDAEEEGGYVYLVPLDALPLDIAGRFVGGGRVIRLPPDQRLRALLGKEGGRVDLTLDASVWSGALAGYLLARGERLEITAPGGRVTGDLLMRRWWSARWGAPAEPELGSLLAWAVRDGRGAEFVRDMEGEQASGLRNELHRRVEARAGKPGLMAFRAWEAGRGDEALGLSLLCEATEEPEAPAMRSLVSRIASERFKVQLPWEEIGAVIQGLAEGVPLAMQAIPEDARDSVIAEAQRLLAQEPDPSFPQMMTRSSHLPIAWRLRHKALAASIEAALVARDPEALQKVAAALRALFDHTLSRARPIEYSRAEMTARLCAWLCGRPHDRLEEALGESLAPDDPVAILARWYTEEGGYVDWARRRARAAVRAGDAFGEAAKSVLDAADELRQALDRRFASALVDWCGNGRPDRKVLPIERALSRLAVPYLKGADDRRLLILLLDGMAWAQAVELLESLGELKPAWAPLASFVSGRHGVGEGYYAPVLAALPTLTDVSRSAFFAGKLMTPGKRHKTGDDPRRFAQHSGLARLFEGGRAPRLLLRTEAHTGSGEPSDEALRAIGREDEPVVALVINAIDTALKRSPEHEVAWRVASIRSLPELLRAASNAGRAVLLASDHGHVPCDRLQWTGTHPSEGGARWRALSEGEEEVPGEIGLTRAHAWVPRGAAGVALPIDDTRTYKSARNWGEHGGATLAEVVAPALLLQHEPQEGRGERDLVRAYRPSWWHLDLDAPDVGRRRAKSRRRASAQEKDDRTLELNLRLAPAPALEPAPQPAPVLHPLAVALEKSEEFTARVRDSAERQKIVAAIAYLLHRGGVAPTSAFADAVGEPVFRVGGAVSRFAEHLNVDGYPILRHDSRAHQVVLERALLIEGYDLTSE